MSETEPFADGEPTLPSTAMTSAAQAQVLVVEDDPEIREFVTMVLEGEGYGVRGAENGQVALEQTETGAVDLILLDMRMPVLDGWGFVRQYRERTAQPVPIVVMTAAPDARARAAEVAATAYLAKPFDLHELLETVAAQLQAA